MLENSIHTLPIETWWRQLMSFYKLTFSIFLLIFIACSSNIETNNSEETNTFVQVSTITTAMEAGEGIDLGKAFSNFENYWKPLLKENRSLTDEELKITYALRELMDQEFDYFEFRNANSLEIEGKISEARLFYAIYKGQTRLIDNIEA